MTSQDEQTRPSRARSLAISALKAIVSIGLLAVLFSRVDVSRLWAVARQASSRWLGAALLLYLAMVLSSAVRWGVLLRAQHVRLPFSFLTQSFLVATFFNNFLPSNIGGDVIRITDTAPAAGSKTLATTVVLIDRGLGLLGLALMAATGASLMQRMASDRSGRACCGQDSGSARSIATPALLMPDAVAQAAPAASRVPPGMGGRADREAHLRADALQGNAGGAGVVLRRRGGRPGDPGAVLRRDRATACRSRSVLLSSP